MDLQKKTVTPSHIVVYETEWLAMPEMPEMPMLHRQATLLPGDKTDFVAKHTSFLLSLESRIQSIPLYGVSEMWAACKILL